MPVNEVITDSVTQVNTTVIGDTPAAAGGNLLLSTSQAMGMSALNSINANQQASVVFQSSTVQGVNALLSTGAAVLGRGVEIILEKSES